MKEEVKIIAICDPKPNYGNRLQNYAVQYIVERLGLKALTIIENRPVCIKRLIKYVLQVLSGYCFGRNKQSWKEDFLQRYAFDRFSKRFI